MKYTRQMFKQDFKDTLSLTFKSFKYEYFVALEDIPKWEGDWKEEKMFFAYHAKTKQTILIHNCNVHADIKKNEIFIGGIYKNVYRTSVSVCRGTGIFTLPKKKTYSRNTRVAQEVMRIRSKRERPVYRWYEKTLEEVNKKIRMVEQELKENFCYWKPPKQRTKFKFNASKKRIKTKYGKENNAYATDFILEDSVFPGKKYFKADDLKRFQNKKEFKEATFPLYKVVHNDICYLFEEKDFEKLSFSEMEIKYTNQWGDEIDELEREAKKYRKWLNRCIKNIKIETCKKYQYPVQRCW